jgi:hypothetical protein
MRTDLLVSSLAVMLAGAEPRGRDLIGLDLNEAAPLALVDLVFPVVPSS